MRSGIPRRSPLTLALLLAVACSSNPAPGAPAAAASADSGVVGCGAPGDTYVANLAKPGALGRYTFTLVQASPAPPALNANVWVLKVVDSTGASPDLAQMTVYPFMPLMGHPSSQTPQLDSKQPDGRFTAKDVDLFMPGLWTVTVSVYPPGSDAGAGQTPTALDEAVFTFCIE